MLILSQRTQLIIAAALVLLLIITRGHHFAGLHNLPSASTAVFLLAGIYLRPAWVFPALLTIAGGLDFAAVTWGGVSNFCVSPAYPLLIPAYAALWLAGRWYARHYHFEWRTLLPLFAAMLVGAVVCELFSSGGFYFLSGQFTDTTLVEFGGRFATYFPFSLQSIVFYTALATVIHIIFTLLRGVSGQRGSVQS